MAARVPASRLPAGSGSATAPRGGYRTPGPVEKRQRAARRRVQPSRAPTNQQIGTKVAAGSKARGKAAAGGVVVQAAAPAAVPAAAAGPAAVVAPAAPPAPAAPRAPRSAGTEGAGALLALFLYPLLVNALKGGPGQARQWLAAKFINQGTGSGPGSGAGGGGSLTLPSDFLDPFPGPPTVAPRAPSGAHPGVKP